MRCRGPKPAMTQDQKREGRSRAAQRQYLRGVAQKRGVAPDIFVCFFPLLRPWLANCGCLYRLWWHEHTVVVWARPDLGGGELSKLLGLGWWELQLT